MSINDENVHQIQLYASQIVGCINRQPFWSATRTIAIKRLDELMWSIVKASRGQKEQRELWGPHWEELRQIKELLETQPEDPAIEDRFKKLLLAIAPPPAADTS